MGRATMRADHLGAGLRRLEQSLFGALPEFRAERARVGRCRVEVSNCLLQPGNNLVNRSHGLFRQVAPSRISTPPSQNQPILTLISLS